MFLEFWRGELVVLGVSTVYVGTDAAPEIRVPFHCFMGSVALKQPAVHATAVVTLLLFVVCPRWITDTYELKGLRQFAEDKEFHKQWRAVKQQKKAKLAAYIKEKIGDDVNQDAMFDIQVHK